MKEVERVELVCILEKKRPLDNFVRIMWQPHILSNILQFLNFNEIRHLMEAVKHCNATSDLQHVILHDGLFKIIPYKPSLWPYVESFFNDLRWEVHHSSDDGVKRGGDPKKEFKILHLISYYHNEELKILNSNTTPSSGNGPYTILYNVFSVAGKLEDETVFLLYFKHSNRWGGVATVIYAPTYKDLINSLIRKGRLNQFINHLNTSRELINELMARNPEEIAYLLEKALKPNPIDY